MPGADKILPKTLDGLANKALGPAAEEFGKELAPVGKELGVVTAKVGNMLIKGLAASVYGLEQIGDWIKTEVSERLKDVPEDQIVEPNPRIAIPATQSLLYSMGDETIRDMFANLLAADMNAKTKGVTHPAFVEMIKEMTSADATALSVLWKGAQIEFRARVMSGNQWRELGYSYSFDIEGVDATQVRRTLSNLRRLEVIETRPNEWPLLGNLSALEEAAKAKFEPQVDAYKQLPEDIRSKIIMPGELRLDIFKTGLFVTAMGEDFARICLSKRT